MRRLRCPSTSSVQKEKLRGRSEQQTAGPPKFPPLALLVVPRRPRTGPSKRRSEEHWRGVWRKAGGSCDKFARLLFSSVVGLRGTCGLVELIARRDSFFLETCHKSASLCCSLGSTDTVSERLRRWTRDPLGSTRRGSNPLGVVARKLAALRPRSEEGMPLPALNPQKFS